MASKNSRKDKVPAYRSEPRWDNSRNVSTYGRRLYPVSASLLKHLGDILKVTPVNDGDGGYKYTTSVRVKDAYMSVKQLRAEQIFDYRGNDVKATHLIRVRYETEVEESDFITTDEGKTYEVVWVDPDRQGFLYKAILCTEMR